MTPRKWRRLALAVIALAIAAQLSISLLVRTHRVHAYLTTHLERAFGRPVEVGRFGVQLLPSPSFEAEDIRVGEDAAFGYEYFLRAERMTAALRWTGLLRGHFEFGTLSLSQPSLILVRNAEGRWNLESWLPPAKLNEGRSARIYGPPSAPTPVNRLEKIEFDDARIDFKNGDDKLPFAFISVSGVVDQVSRGRWQLRLRATPWRSGISLQSTGTLTVQGDLAGTSARLQPAEIRMHWEQASLADLFRLLQGQDYGVRGVFSLDATAKSGVPPNTSAVGKTSSGDWSFALQAQTTQIHRWDLTERLDNPQMNVSVKGRWNVAAGDLFAEEIVVQAPKSNLRATGSMAIRATPSLQLRIDSAGIQGADLLAWWRAFQPGIDEGVRVDLFFTGALTLGGWPLKLQQAAFSSRGGNVTVPDFAEPLRIGSIRGGRERNRFVIEPVHLSFGGGPRPASLSAVRSTSRAASTKVAAILPRKLDAADIRNFFDIGLTHDFDTKEGAITLSGHVDRMEDVLKLSAAFGHTLNRGWELTGQANAALRWEWKEKPFRGLWNGQVGILNAQLQAAGLNLPLQIDEAQLRWNDGERSAQIARAEGFGGIWSGPITKGKSASAENGTEWNFALHVDHLDATELDRWVGPRARPGWLQRLLPSLLGNTSQRFGTTVSASELLRRVNADGELTIDKLSVEKLEMGPVHLTGSLRGLEIDVSRAEAQWAGGRVTAKMSAEFLPKPAYEITAQWDHVNLAEILKVDPVTERLSGTASGTMHLTTQGVGRDELLQKLEGRGDIDVKDVEFRGWDVNGTVVDGSARAGTSRWKDGKGSFSLRDRKFFLDTLLLDGGKDLTVVNGTIGFGWDSDLAIETAKPGKRFNGERKSGRVLKISGPLDEPHVLIENASPKRPAD